MTTLTKKRLMYLSGEDYYFFTYSTLLLLHVLKCENGKYFKDYRKIPFLIDIIKDENALFILERALQETDKLSDERVKRKLNDVDKEYLFRSYSSGVARRSEILKLLFTLEKSSYVSLRRGERDFEIDVTLNLEAVPPDFFSAIIFGSDIRNIKRLQASIKRLSSLTLSTMIERIYDNNGVKTWAL